MRWESLGSVAWRALRGKGARTGNPGRRRPGSRSRPPPRPAPSCGEALTCAPVQWRQKVVGNRDARRARCALAHCWTVATIAAALIDGVRRPPRREADESHEDPISYGAHRRGRDGRLLAPPLRRPRVAPATDPDGDRPSLHRHRQLRVGLEHVRLQRPEPRRVARRLRPLRGRAGRDDRRARAAADPLPAHDRPQPPAIGIEMVQATGRGSHWADQQILDRRPQIRRRAAPRRAGSRAATGSRPASVIGHSMANDRPLLQGPRGVDQRPHRLAQARRQGVPPAAAAADGRRPRRAAPIAASA